MGDLNREAHSEAGPARATANEEAAIEEVAETFELMEDWTERYQYLIELGAELRPMREELKTAETKVRGCLSQVWLVADHEAGVMRYTADSDAHIVKGLVAVVLRLFDGKPPEAVVAIDAAAWLRRLGLDQHLSPGRSNGLHSMIQRAKTLAAAAQ